MRCKIAWNDIIRSVGPGLHKKASHHDMLMFYLYIQDPVKFLKVMIYWCSNHNGMHRTLPSPSCRTLCWSPWATPSSSSTMSSALFFTMLQHTEDSNSIFWEKYVWQAISLSTLYLLGAAIVGPSTISIYATMCASTSTTCQVPVKQTKNVMYVRFKIIRMWLRGHRYYGFDLNLWY